MIRHKMADPRKVVHADRKDSPGMMGVPHPNAKYRNLVSSVYDATAVGGPRPVRGYAAVPPCNGGGGAPEHARERPSGLKFILSLDLNTTDFSCVHSVAYNYDIFDIFSKLEYQSSTHAFLSLSLTSPLKRSIPMGRYCNRICRICLVRDLVNL